MLPVPPLPALPVPDLTLGFLTSAALIIAIGAQNAFVLRQGLRREHVVPVVAVCAVADVLLIGLGVLGLGAVVEQNPVALAVARYGGAAFLLGYGVRTAVRVRRSAALAPREVPTSGRRAAVLTTAALTFLNPHVYLDTVVLLGSLAQQHHRGAFYLGAVGASLTWFTALGAGARYLAPLLARPRAWQVLDAGIALVMIGLAVLLVLGPL